MGDGHFMLGINVYSALNGTKYDSDIYTNEPLKRDSAENFWDAWDGSKLKKWRGLHQRDGLF